MWYQNFIVLSQILIISLVKGNKIEIEHPNVEVKNSTAYEFVPRVTLIGLGFTAISFLLLALAKIMYSSSEHYTMNNKYDLAIFKAPNKNSLVGLRRVYKNNDASDHNLNAALACGFDITKILNHNYELNSDKSSQMPRSSDY
ncbi:unnamed protein product [Brachionus calyciflorus]|uniref:Uncharacterized protein n=1 Tax=Brachionus calyciflorus TaxID=104777 RepID=A0A813MC55_9BILA|nr:unnamed protein product [Brachionus calyciflorus]